jgi:flagellar hook assembly protein FlgD
MDAIGQTVKVLFNGPAIAGKNTLAWNGKNDRGVKCASGVYYYILTLGGKNYGNKMVIIK